MEEFVSDDDIRKRKCTISLMKRMLCNRGALETASGCRLKADFMREVEKCRIFNEECVICSDQYIAG